MACCLLQHAVSFMNMFNTMAVGSIGVKHECISKASGQIVSLLTCATLTGQRTGHQRIQHQGPQMPTKNRPCRPPVAGEPSVPRKLQARSQRAVVAASPISPNPPANNMLCPNNHNNVNKQCASGKPWRQAQWLNMILNCEHILLVNKQQ